MTQLNLIWRDIRLPQEVADHYIAHGTCINCRRPMKSYEHQLNHWAAKHTKKPEAEPRPRLKRTTKRSSTPRYASYRVWKPGARQWQTVSEERALQLQKDGFCIARIKRWPTPADLRDRAA